MSKNEIPAKGVNFSFPKFKQDNRYTVYLISFIWICTKKKKKLRTKHVRNK